MDTNIRPIKMKYIHIRRKIKGNPVPCGGVTVAYKTEERYTHDVHTVSLAVCSERDNYCKRTGRDKAVARFLEGTFYTIQTDPDDETIPQILDTLEELFSNHILLDHLDKISMKALKREVHNGF